MLVVRAIPVNVATFLGYEYSMEMYQKYTNTEEQLQQKI